MGYEVRGKYFYCVRFFFNCFSDSDSSFFSSNIPIWIGGYGVRFNGPLAKIFAPYSNLSIHWGILHIRRAAFNIVNAPLSHCFQYCQRAAFASLASKVIGRAGYHPCRYFTCTVRTSGEAVGPLEDEPRLLRRQEPRPYPSSALLSRAAFETYHVTSRRVRTREVTSGSRMRYLLQQPC